MRFLLAVFPTTMPYWTAVVATLSVVTMLLGNTLALAQRNIKRLLAYSSIAHAGYMLIGVVAVSKLGITGVIYYLVAYLLTNLAAFGIVVTFWRVVGSDDLDAYKGLSRRSPGLALAMLVSFLSLAGMPPLGGFIAKLLVFAAAVQANMVWLAIVGVLNSIIGLYYYLTVLKYVYLYRSEDEKKPLPVPRPYAVALIVLTIGIILVGSLFAPWYSWSATAAAAIF
jgi:NADH-quinone oxidoreductase subunit N